MKKTILALVVLIVIGVGVYALSDINTAPTATPSPTPMGITTLQVETLVEGTGNPAKAGDTVSALYEGRRLDGSILDASSRHGNEPFSFVIGSGQVIRGWDEGLLGAKAGSKVRLSIPADYAYGDADLIFEVEIVKITTP